MSKNNQNTKEEIDELKSLWHSQRDERPYDSDKIFKMIHHKSINSVHWLFIISLLELLIGLVITVWSWLSGGHYYSKSSIELMGETNIQKLETFSSIGYVFSLILIGIIWYYYRKITADSSVNTLIRNIIYFRRAVIICLVSIVAILLIFMFPIYFDIGKNIATQNVIKTHHGADIGNFKKSIEMTSWGVATGATVTIGVFFFVYYFVIYGFFLRRLKKNQKELNKIKD